MRAKYELWQIASSLGGNIHARKGDVIWDLDRVVEPGTIETGGIYKRNIHLVWTMARIGGWTNGAARKVKTRVVVSSNGLIGTNPVYTITAKRFASLEWMLDCPLSRQSPWDVIPVVYMPWSKGAKLR